MPWSSNSTKETKIMTPAEKPRDNVRNFGPGFLTIRLRMLPIIVARPARRERSRANPM